MLRTSTGNFKTSHVILAKICWIRLEKSKRGHFNNNRLRNVQHLYTTDISDKMHRPDRGGSRALFVVELAYNFHRSILEEHDSSLSRLGFEFCKDFTVKNSDYD